MAVQACPSAEGGLGYACIAEQRTVETLRHGEARTPFMHYGDKVRIEMKDARGHSIFGGNRTGSRAPCLMATGRCAALRGLSLRAPRPGPRAEADVAFDLRIIPDEVDCQE